jgi:hypothetical protein
MDKAAANICGCEQISLHKLSPGVVLDDEEVHFVVCHPDGTLDDGKLNPTFLIQLAYHGLSVLRASATDSEFELTLLELKERWNRSVRKFHGIATFRAGKIRYNGDDRLCCVYDTAMPGKPHHADIAGPGIKAENNSELKKLRHRRIKFIIDNAVLQWNWRPNFGTASWRNLPTNVDSVRSAAPNLIGRWPVRSCGARNQSRDRGFAFGQAVEVAHSADA